MQETKPKKIAIIGAGKYGSALVTVFQDSSVNLDIVIWTRQADKADEINIQRTSANVSPLIKFNQKVRATTNLEECYSDADFIVLSLPSANLSEFLVENKAKFSPKSFFVNTAKGMLIKTGQFVHQMFGEIFPNEMDRYIVLSGPSFADDMFKKSPTLVLLSGKNKEKVRE